MALALTACNSSNEEKQMGAFDKSVWLENAGNESKNNPRAQMLNPIMEDLLKAGMGREEVHELLGPPDSKTEARDMYDIGRSPWGIDLEYLQINYLGDKVQAFFVARG